MSLSDSLRSSPIAGYAVAGAILIVAILILARSGPDAPVNSSWYFDLETHKQVAGGAKPPTSTAVSARVFACNGCDGEQFVGYLETINPDPPPPPSDRPVDPAAHSLIAAVPDPGVEPKWWVGGTPEARAVVQEPAERCGQRYRECLP